jgi:hypothetical protein
VIEILKVSGTIHFSIGAGVTRNPPFPEQIPREAASSARICNRNLLKYYHNAEIRMLKNSRYD